MKKTYRVLDIAKIDLVPAYRHDDDYYRLIQEQHWENESLEMLEVL